MTKISKPVERWRLWLLGGVILAASGDRCLIEIKPPPRGIPPYQPDGPGGSDKGPGGHGE